MFTRLSPRWRVPALSGLLLTAALVVDQLVGHQLLADVMMTAAAVVAGGPILLAAVRALRVRTIGIDLLVAVAAIGAIVIGEYWEAAAVTFLFAVGHALEAATLTRTRNALAELVAVAPDVAVVLHNGEQVEVPAGAVEPGTTVLVRNGARVPIDGEVIGGSGSIDEATITGESIPVEKATGDTVFAGTVSHGGFLRVRATGVGADTTLARIIHRVEQAQDARARTQQFMDRFSAWYTPAIVVLAAVAGVVTGDVALALTLLVIGCPGALVISIPVAIVAGIGRAARDGILIKGGEHLEAAARITAVAVDKTGTLTHGRPHLTDVRVVAGDVTDQDVLRWAARAEAGSEHPLARPVVEAANRSGLGAVGLPDTAEPVAGHGIAATVDSHRVLVGNAAMLTRSRIDDPAAVETAEELATAGRTPMIVAVDGRVLGVLGVADAVRPDAAAMVDALHAAGVRRVVMLTGDAPAVAHAVADAAAVDEVHAGLLPEDKLDVVTALQRDGHTVAMVGDGVNDAPALATADIGVAMGAAGSGVAIETADIALMADRLSKLPDAIVLARRTVRTMRQNVTIALVTVGLLLAGVLAGGVTMTLGMLVHEASVLIVIANAMRLLRHRPGLSAAGRPSPMTAAPVPKVAGARTGQEPGDARCRSAA